MCRAAAEEHAADLERQQGHWSEAYHRLQDELAGVRAALAAHQQRAGPATAPAQVGSRLSSH